MEKRPPKPMTPFDELVIPPKLQTLKLLLPYTPAGSQEFLGVFIKFLELRQTMDFFNTFGNVMHSQAFDAAQNSSPADLMEDLKPYMEPKEAEMMDTISNMMNIMEMVQMFQENEASAENPGGKESGAGFNPLDMMMGMLTPDQQEMFQTYSTMFSEQSAAPAKDNESTKKGGDDPNERMDEPPGHEEY